MSEWWYGVDGNITGPVSSADLKRLATEGLVTRDTLVLKGGSKKWVAAEKVRGLFDTSDKGSLPHERSGEQSVTPGRSLVPSGGAIPSQLTAKPARVLAGKAATFKQRAVRHLRWSRIIAAAALVFLLVSIGVYYGFRSGGDSTVAVDVIEEPTQEQPATAAPGPDYADQLAALTEEIKRLKQQADEGSQTTSVNDRIDRLTQEIDRLKERPSDDPTLGVQLAAKESEEKPTASQRTEIVKAVQDGVVRIRTNDGRLGSGFVCDKNGNIVTNYHVINGARSAQVIFRDGSTAKVIGFLAVVPGKDIAVLRIGRPANKLRPIPINDKLPSTGADLLAFGAPLGIGLSEPTVSEGIVSAMRVGRELRAEIYKTFGYDPDAIWIQSTAAISPGNSGGPLIDSTGKVVGINTWIDKKGQSLNFAISSIEILRVINSLPKKVRPLSELPSPPPDVVAKQKRDKAEEQRRIIARERVRLGQLQRIYAQRSLLLRQWDSSNARLKRLASDLALAQAEYARLDAEARSLNQSAAAVRNRASSVRQRLQFEQDPNIAAQLQSQYQNLEAEHRALFRRFKALEASAGKAKLFAANVLSQMSSEQAQLRQIVDAGNKLRDEWLAITTPFAKLTRGEHERAIVTFSEWIILEGRSPLPYLARGVAYLKIGQHERAQADFVKAGLLDPAALPTALALFGRSQDLLGNEKAALSKFKQASKLDKTNPFARLYRAYIFVRNGKHKLAVAEIKTALIRLPKDAEANCAMAWLLSTAPSRVVRNGRKAVAHATTACEATQWDDWQCLDTLAAAYAEAGDFVKAVSWSRKAIALAPADQLAALESRLNLFRSEKSFRSQ